MTSLTITDLTTSDVNGTGVFDKLMQSVESHIQQEFNRNRIKGPEYATVYLGALQSTLDQSIRFLFDKDDAALKAKQLVLMDAQIAEMQARVSLTTQQAANAILEGNLLSKQVEKLTAELSLIGNQELKTVAETSLLTQKTETEKAQVNGTGVLEGSILGRQMELYKNQADGFLRDAEQRATKIMAETFSIRHSMDSNGNPANPENRLQDKYVGSAIRELLKGVKVDVAALDAAL